MKKIVVTIAILLICFSMQAQEPWKLAKDKNGIQVFTRLNKEYSFREFKAVSTLEASPERFLAVLYDVEALLEWGHNIVSVDLIERKSEKEQVYHAVAKAPWPYKNRDGIYKNTISWNSTERTLRVDIELVEDDERRSEDHVRMHGYGHWEYRDLQNGTGAVTFQMQVDPGGSIKAWMANMFTSDSPYQTLLGLKEVISDQKYSNKTYDLIR